MKKIIIIFSMLLICLNAEAKSLKNLFNDIITESAIPKESVSISIKNIETGKPLYLMNDKILMHPASVQKILTLPAAIDILGEDYEYSTSIYSRGNGEYILKLGADPFLSYSDLKSLVKVIEKDKVKKIYVDDSIIEPKDWGEGWQWDDDLNTSMPRFNSYNLDSNIAKITVMPQNNEVIILNPSKYPFIFDNNVKQGETNSVTLLRDSNFKNALRLEGTVSTPQVLYFPINDLKSYFNIKFNQALASRNIYLKDNLIPSKTKSSDKLLLEIKHPIVKAEEEILKNSNNMIIETTLKVAGGKAYNKTGSDKDIIKLFNEFCLKNTIDNSHIRLVDASGVSKNNLVDANFITNYLIKFKDNAVIQKMAKPGEGTLANRMLPLEDNLRAKTGTLSDISSIAGFITSKKGNKYAFCIIINDPKSTNSDKKNLENNLIKEIYFKG